MRMEGLEPPCREALDPKSSASTNFATSAYQDRFPGFKIRNAKLENISHYTSDSFKKKYGC